MAQTNPWLRLMTMGMDMAETGWRAGETMLAAGSVIEHRSKLMQAAAQRPLDADHRELARMVPEKVAAFSAAGSAMVDAWWGMQAELAGHARQVGTAMLSGRAPDVATIARLQRRTAEHGLRLAEQAVAAGAAALAPVHGKATANARRLARRK